MVGPSGAGTTVGGQCRQLGDFVCENSKLSNENSYDCLNLNTMCNTPFSHFVETFLLFQKSFINFAMCVISVRSRSRVKTSLDMITKLAGLNDHQRKRATTWSRQKIASKQKTLKK